VVEVNYSPPQPINSSFILADFNCGEVLLDNWLKHKALKNERNNASRTYVVCVDNVVVAYYSLHTGSIQHSVLSGKFKRNMPNPIPALVMGRLAVDIKHQGVGLSTDLIREVYLKSLKAAEITGIAVLVVNALNLKVVGFYEKFGFVPSKSDPLLLIKSIAQIKASYKAK